MFFARIGPGFDFGNILPYRGADVARFCEEILGEFRNVAAGDPESVMHYQNLPVGHVTCADADNRDRQRFGDAFCQLYRHALQHQQLRAGLFQR